MLLPLLEKASLDVSWSWDSYREFAWGWTNYIFVKPFGHGACTLQHLLLQHSSTDSLLKGPSSVLYTVYLDL